MQLRLKLAAVAVAGAASVALAGAPALASSQASAGKAITGPEIIVGAVHGKEALVNAPIIPLRLRGLVNTRSVVNLGGSGPRKGDVKTFRTPRGNLAVMVTSKPQNNQSLNNKTCRFSFTTVLTLKVVSGKSTGAFAGASGPGAVQVSFAANAPRFTSGPKKGQCNPNGRPHTKGAVASFLGSLVLTVKY
jgi:hypothetical protein